MATINQYFDFAQLAQASYSSLLPGVPNVFALKTSDGAGFAQQQADTFALGYTVLSQSAPNANGFSATLFQNNATGQKILAIRGTDDLFDGLTDVVSIALLGTTALQSQYQSLKNYYQQLITEGKLAADETFSVTGHSLGGFLAQSFAVDYAGKVSQAYTYNAPGIGGVVADVLNALGVTATNISVANITNIIAQPGLSATAGLGTMLGNVENVFIEQQTNPFNNHKIGFLSDSLAVYNLFTQLVPTLNTDPNGLTTITNILKASSNDGPNTLEAAVSDVGKLFLVQPTFISNEFDDNRDLLYLSLDNIKNKLPTTGGLQLISLADSNTNNPSAILAKANQSGAEGMAYRYALANLNPFAVIDVGDTLYGPHNQNGELNLYDPNATTNPGALTEQYLTDRAAMLAAVIQANTNDAGAVIVNSGDSFTYQDVERNLTLDVLNTANFGGLLPPLQYKVIFGDNNDDTLTGTNGNDRIYAGGGNDTLNGGAGGDYLEGGRGDDAYVGLNEHDTVLDVQGNDSYQLTGNADATITDVDGIGDIAWDGTPVTGGSLQSGDTNADGRLVGGAEQLDTGTNEPDHDLLVGLGGVGYDQLIYSSVSQVAAANDEEWRMAA